MWKCALKLISVLYVKIKKLVHEPFVLGVSDVLRFSGPRASQPVPVIGTNVVRGAA